MFDLCANIFSAAGKTAAELSDTELATHYPVVGLSVAALFLAGIVVDVYLLTRWAMARHDRVNLFTLRTAPWSLLEMAGATGIFLFATFVVEVTLGLFLGDHPALILGAGIGLRVALLVALGAYFRYRQQDWTQALGLTPKPPLSALIRGAVLYVGIFPALVILVVGQDLLCRAVGLEIKPQEITQLFLNTDSTAAVALLTAFALIVAPVFEEVLFRGLAYPVLKQRFGTARALVLVSAAFALIHFHLPSVIPLFVLAGALTLAYELTGSLWASIILHALFNTTSVAMLLYVRAHP